MKPFAINDRLIGPGQPAYIIAELSANHHQNVNEAIQLIRLAKESGADAVKIQTYTADTMTIDCGNEHFQIGAGTIWEGKSLYELYGEAYTPWEWTPRLIEAAEKIGITLFSTPFDESALNYLELLEMPAHKVASFELVDLPLIAKIAACGKPVILSTGMGTLEEIEDAVRTLRENGCEQFALLKCTSAYPAPMDEANLSRIPDMINRFGVPVGLSDHTMGGLTPAIAVTLGACIIEKHFTRSRKVPGPDSAFSMEPAEFSEMVQQVRAAEAALGSANYELTAKEESSRVFRRSLFVVEEMKAGEAFTERNTRVIRPGFGLAPKHLESILDSTAASDIKRGTPLTWELVQRVT
ncbi:pseudaminic acid synthase [Coraliomargarita sinensis]|uniref:Pseudaminic acid synthase n=1 Tax=Coraliomargarita sinensis TaxID=2174842 RepID=A0A317ZNX3_9BACT|nr:pseudaminic acid synthase [Coraliomargarita sinensis]PXA05559.1 pseudaminic acid synthase [Coraliomargarita sinensis]